MARLISGQRPKIKGQKPYPSDPMLDVVPVSMFSPPRGMNSAATVNRLPPEYARSLTNLILDKGKLRTRPGLHTVGDSGTNIVEVISFMAEGIGNLIRLTTTGIESWDGQNTWTPVAGVSFTGNPDSFSFAGWGTKLLIANGRDPILVYDPIGASGEFIEGSPIASHITTFGGRVVASAVYDPGFKGSRIKWSAKNDYTIWTDPNATEEEGEEAVELGAGFEDLLSTPGGYVDEVMGVFPITDELALVVREYTVWQMALTGDPEAPFRFSRLQYEVGSRSRRAIVVVPDGVIFPSSQNDVILMNTSSIKSIGEPCREDIFDSVIDPTKMRGIYDPMRQEYRVKAEGLVWRYRFTDQGWTRDAFGDSGIKSLSFVRYNNLGLTFDQLSSIAVPDGTFDEIPGTFDELSSSGKDAAVYYVNGDGTAVLRENPGFFNDHFDEQPGWELVTGVIDSQLLHKTMLVEVQLEYEAMADQVVKLEYSTNDFDWTEYSTGVLPAADVTRIYSFRRTIEAENIQLRISSDDITTMKIYSFNPFICKGARVRS